ncbi:unnamed protein product [Cuscuta europaea]|uniref:Uncharacterized protein n=1 Tax=Cuscuta europaea TaxID=41803 RepID=A0A9P0ZMA0_CUSEU|nr:unnamed protein product [Cuscuta europaea]
MREARELQKKLTNVAAVEMELRKKVEEADRAVVQALEWLSTPEGEVKLDEEGALCFQLGRYGMQKAIYEVLLGRDPSFTASSWGLPEPVVNLEASQVSPAS